MIHSRNRKLSITANLRSFNNEVGVRSGSLEDAREHHRGSLCSSPGLFPVRSQQITFARSAVVSGKFRHIGLNMEKAIQHAACEHEHAVLTSVLLRIRRLDTMEQRPLPTVQTAMMCSSALINQPHCALSGPIPTSHYSIVTQTRSVYLLWDLQPWRNSSQICPRKRGVLRAVGSLYEVSVLQRKLGNCFLCAGSEKLRRYPVKWFMSALKRKNTQGHNTHINPPTHCMPPSSSSPVPIQRLSSPPGV